MWSRFPRNDDDNLRGHNSLLSFLNDQLVPFFSIKWFLSINQKGLKFSLVWSFLFSVCMWREGVWSAFYMRRKQRNMMLVSWTMLQRQGFWLALPMFCWPKITRKIALSFWTGPLSDSSILHYICYSCCCLQFCDLKIWHKYKKNWFVCMLFNKFIFFIKFY